MKPKATVQLTQTALILLLNLIPIWVFAQALPELMYYKFNTTGNLIPNEASPATRVSTNATLTGLTVGNNGLTGTALVGNNGASATNNVSMNWAMSSLGTSDWTIGFWLNNVPANTTIQYIFGDNGTFRCFKGGAAPTNGLILRGNFTDVPITTNITNGPNYIHFVRTPTNMQAYVNGVLVNTVNQAAVTITSTGPFLIGGQANNAGLASNMLLDEFRLYNRALTPTEIAQTWNMELNQAAFTLANFVYDPSLDTVWLQSNHTFLNISNNAGQSYWDILSYSSNGPNGPFTPWQASRTCDFSPNGSGGCYMVPNSTHFTYNFQTQGWYKVKLKIKGNGQQTDSIEKIIYADTPSAPPVIDFYSDKVKSGKWGEVNFFDYSEQGVNQWNWYLDPPCTNCANSAFYNQFANNAVKNPVLYTNDPGVYKVCLDAANLRGISTLCKNNYLEIEPGYQMCNGSDTFATNDSGWVFLYTLNGLYYPNNIAGCNKGMTISACADSIILHIDRYRFRNVDTLEVRTEGLNGPIVTKYGGNTFNTIPNSLKRLSIPGNQVFLRMKITGAGNPGPNDSGFAIRWTIAPPTFNKPLAGFICPDTVFSGYKIKYQNVSSGEKPSYAWDTNGDGIFGLDNPASGVVDSTIISPTQTFINNGSTPILKRIGLVVRNCRGVDTFYKQIVIMPIMQAPIPDFVVTPNLAFVTDTFRFFDRSSKGALQWQWSFSPSNITYLPGSNANSQNPEVLLNNAIKYSVTLRVTNQAGSNSITKSDIVEARAYFPATSSNLIAPGMDIGISRVVINDIDHSTDLKNPIYHDLTTQKKTVLYRGVSYQVDAYRQSINSPMTTRVWIDFNRNARFNDPKEMVVNEVGHYNIRTGKLFTVPSDAAIGNSRLRVGITFGTSNLTHEWATTGCFEDYGIEIGHDKVKPTIQLIGPALVKTEVNKPYIEQKVFAFDNLEGDISNRYEVEGFVDTSMVGYYTLKYYVKDLYGNVSDTVIRLVQVEINRTGPSIQLIGADTIKILVGTLFTDPGVQAFDNRGNNISSQVVKSGSPVMNQLGFYTITYSVTDAFGYNASKNRVIEVMDNQIPSIIKLTGTPMIEHQVGTPFDDATYIKVGDNYWTNISPIRSGYLDINSPGFYPVVYNATDGSGNHAIPFPVTIHVKDKILPTAVLLGDAEMEIEVFSLFNDPFVLATDNYSTVTILVNSNLNPNKIGTYQIQYIVCDADNNCITLTRKVKVSDKTAPVIKLMGTNPYHVYRFKPYKDPGVKITDNYDNETQLQQFLTVDTSSLVVHIPGLYIVTYRLRDSSGNQAQDLIRFVQVGDTLTGLQTILSDGSLAIFPNPSANGLYTIQSEQTTIKGIQVYNLLGKAIVTHSFENTYQTQLDLSAFNHGVYLLCIEHEDGKISTHKLIKQ